MRLGLIADIHGNLPALEKVLAELEREGVDQILCLGDVAIGPQPVETLERIRSLGSPVTMGNWDAWYLTEMPKLDGELGRVLGDLRAWSMQQLSEGHRRFVSEFAKTVEVPFEDGGKLLAFHGSPRSFDDSIFSTTSDEDVEKMMGDRAALVLAGGHTHFQLFRRIGESVFVNPGSVGLPFRRMRPGIMRIAPWAEYGVVAYQDSRLAVELRRTAVDVDAFIGLMRSSGMPHADWWAELWQEESPATSSLA